MKFEQIQPFSWNDPNLKFEDAVPLPEIDLMIGIRPIVTDCIVHEDGTGTIKMEFPSIVQSNPTDLA